MTFVQIEHTSEGNAIDDRAGNDCCCDDCGCTRQAKITVLCTDCRAGRHVPCLPCCIASEPHARA